MKLNVQTKLLAGFLAVVAMVVIVGGVAIVKLDSIHKVTEDYSADTVPSANNVGDLRTTIGEVRKDQGQYILKASLGADARALAETAAEIEGEYVDVDRAIEATRTLTDDAAGAAGLRTLQGAWQTYRSESQGLRPLVAAGDYRAALTLIADGGSADQAYDTIKEGLAAIQAANARSAAAQDETADSTVSSARTIVIVLAIVAAIIGVGLALTSARWISGALSQLLRAARGIAGGDVEQDVQVKSRDELGETAAAFREMIAYLEQMAEAARRIAAGDLAVDVRAKSDRDALGTAFAAMSRELRDALGDESALEALVDRMESLRRSDLADLEAALAAVAAGDLTVAVTPATTTISAGDGKDLGRLATIFNEMHATTAGSVEAYNAMRAKVAEMLRQIAQESQAVAAASQQMATTSEESGRAVGEIASAVGEVASGAERQVRTVGEARSLAEEVVSTTRASNDNAAETARSAEQARAVAEEGADAIARASEGMRQLADVSSGVDVAMRDLGAKSGQIGGIVATITGIAEQTNLLALNAAIEAARAGEQGRGFAVVAEEVRKLAEESQQAARSISELIDEIQRDTANAITSVEAGGEHMQTGVDTVEEARQSFLRIGSSVEDVSGRVEQIAAAIGEISHSATRMQDNMADVVSVAEQSSASTEQVSASTQQTSASTQEIAASAQELAKTAEELERLVGQFTLTR
ncbi:methyl-accepting chemotaxis protein [Conexibacter sp. JD483]|uniref:HAMP domain-containing methyl-accepting chemotaxis protein n=1 Tax=unclassified Conexibacter TaxID=2627773 RepID=UPI0027246322|nr:MULTISPECIES: methyl-accepting chemotaxis protein [unclassified Conexibacter]MDO8185366.1 methyl-accepting chemotaxis protein [Conexibacter sp. CPCC 205706]MDO8198458.1 methyl-accepting chemotaxis protein [Conexibacter sp. CPCC 205762]MDR9368777.1 methyl-accepting chemotaxis protein [Conexibacter sp. JD483]